MWQFTGEQRPAFAEQPLPGQESVWDYPRPPVLVPSDSQVMVGNKQRPLALTGQALRLLETASPPTYYLPPESVDWTLLVATQDRSMCECKGAATYWALAAAPADGPIGWSYRNPTEYFTAIAGYLSCYPGRIACYVDDERVRPQPGRFYGGWMTGSIAGPVKGEPGTGHW